MPTLFISALITGHETRITELTTRNAELATLITAHETRMTEITDRNAELTSLTAGHEDRVVFLTERNDILGTQREAFQDGCIVTGSVSAGSSDNPNIQNTRPDDVEGINGHAISGDGSPRESNFTDVDLSDLGGSLQTLAGTKGSALNTAINEAAANGGSVPVSMDEVIASRGFRGKTSTEQKRGIGRFSVAVNGSVIAQTGKEGTSFNFVGAASGELDSQDYGADSSRSLFARGATTYGRTRQRISGGQDYNITFFNHQTIDVRGTLPNP